jgi:hypothetical protein
VVEADGRSGTEADGARGKEEGTGEDQETGSRQIISDMRRRMTIKINAQAI